MNRAAINAKVAVKMRARKAVGLGLLGGKCVQCGSTQQLEFDHIDPATKKFTITSCLKMAFERWPVELRKCQLLCRPCHMKKSVLESGRTPVAGRHGTISTFEHCKCPECREAFRQYETAWQSKKRAAAREARQSAAQTHRSAA